MDVKQWAVVQGDRLLATLAWTQVIGRSESLIVATPPVQGDSGRSAEALTQLLIHARRTLSTRANISLEYPNGELTEAFIAAGFTERSTLLWMRAMPAT